MADIFISYARQDREKVEPLAAALESAGLSVWWDRNIQGGETFSEEIARELDAAGAVIAAWSENSVRSEWVLDEAAQARDDGKLVPLRLDNTMPPLGFRQRQALDFSAWSGVADSTEINNLLLAISRLSSKEVRDAAPLRIYSSTVSDLRRLTWPQAAFLSVVGIAIIAALFFFISSARNTSSSRLENSLAVLPFSILESSEEYLYLSEGFSDELRNQLSQAIELNVAARSSSVAFAGNDLTSPEIADRLGVEYLILGALKSGSTQIEIDIEIVDGRTGFRKWAQKYSGNSNDLLNLQQQAATDIVTRLTGQAKRTSDIAAPATQDISAYEKLLLARHYEQEVRNKEIVDREKLDKAISLYKAATEADPESALAHSRLAGALLYAGEVEAAEAPIFRAISLNPNLSEVQYTLGIYYWTRGLPGSGQAYKRAVELNPNNADALGAYGLWLWHQTDDNNPPKYLRRAVELDPLSLVRYSELSTYYSWNGMRSEALALADEISRRFTNAEAYRVIARIYEVFGEYEKTMKWLFFIKKKWPDTPFINSQIAEIYAIIGDYEKAAELEPKNTTAQLYWARRYPELIDVAEELMIDEPYNAQLWNVLAFAYTAVGDYESALRLMKLAGMPGAAISDSRRVHTLDAFVIWLNALEGSGDVESTKKYGEWAVKYFDSRLTQWWFVYNSACSLAIVGQENDALTTLENGALNGFGNLYGPQLLDSHCFKRFANNERYRKVIENLEEQRESQKKKIAAISINDIDEINPP